MIYIGTSGFQYPEWKGTFYPEVMPAAKMLAYYAEHFSTTESNYTFRQMPKVATLEKWAAQTPAGFRFSLKAPQRITHFAKLQNCEDTLRYFCDTAQALGEKLAPVLFQLPPSFKKDVAVLHGFLGNLPTGFRAAFEFRHPSWFEEETYAALRAANVALCIAHSEDLVTPTIATADYGYLRLRKVLYEPDELGRWAEVIASQSQWKETFVYFKHEEAGTGPVFGSQLQELIRSATR